MKTVKCKEVLVKNTDNEITWERYPVQITLVTPMLATSPADTKVCGTYMEAKAQTEEERQAILDDLDTIERMKILEKKGTCIYMKDPEKGVYISGHMLKGFIKESADSLRRTFLKGDKVWGAIKGKVDMHVMIDERKLFVGKMEADGWEERSLRTKGTMGGDQTCLVKSEKLNEGTTFKVTFLLMPDGLFTKDMLEQCLNYGNKHALGAWRNAGWGSFTWDYINE